MDATWLRWEKETCKKKLENLEDIPENSFHTWKVCLLVSLQEGELVIRLMLGQVHLSGGGERVHSHDVNISLSCGC